MLIDSSSDLLYKGMRGGGAVGGVLGGLIGAVTGKRVSGESLGAAAFIGGALGAIVLTITFMVLDPADARDPDDGMVIWYFADVMWGFIAGATSGACGGVVVAVLAGLGRKRRPYQD